MATVSYVSEPVVDPETAEFLEEEGLLSAVVNGYRKISTSLISSPTSTHTSGDPPNTILSEALSAANVKHATNPSPTSLSSHASGAPPNTVSSEAFTAANMKDVADFVDIPADINSRQTYEFLGFNYSTSLSLWQRYPNYAVWMGADIFDYAKWHVKNPAKADATSGCDDWDACMIEMGLNNNLRAAILLPEFSDIRFTATCKYWVIDAIEMKWNRLEALAEELRIERARIQTQRNVSGGRPQAGLMLSDSSQPSPISDKCGKKSRPKAATRTDAPLTMERHTMLWRASYEPKYRPFYDDTTGEINLYVFRNVFGDFSHRRALAYFTTQRELADRYAQWAKRKADVVSIVITQVAVPWSFLEDMSMEHSWFGQGVGPNDTWKELVWKSKHRQRLPERLRHIDKKDILIGHIASSRNIKFETLESAAQIRDSDVLTFRVGGSEMTAVQLAIQSRKAFHGFEEHCRGKIWLHDLGAYKAHK